MDLPGYDAWKTTPPDEPSVVECDECGNDVLAEDLRHIGDRYLCLYCAARRALDILDTPAANEPMRQDGAAVLREVARLLDGRRS